MLAIYYKKKKNKKNKINKIKYVKMLLFYAFQCYTEKYKRKTEFLKFTCFPVLY